MKVLFTVQGEGRGHLTQAIAMQEMLRRRGHEIVGVLVGNNGTRPLPAYFAASFAVDVEEIVGPGFVFHGARGISNRGTVLRLLCDLPRYRGALRALRRAIRRARPDLILNFLEPTMGLHNLLYGARVPTIVVGHQYMLDHPGYVRVPQQRLQQRLMRGYCALVGARSTRLALSFYPAPDLPRRGLFVCPPLLRRQLFELEPVAGDYLLVYLLNHGYADAITRWHTLHPHIPVHCFYDKPAAPAEEMPRPNLTFHRLHGEKFLRLMAGARAVACTAGFESVSEAAYLGKPLLMVPVENHIEQYLNACDAEHAGIGMKDSDFRLARLLSPQAKAAAPEIRRWIGRAEAIALQVVETVAGLRTAAGLPAASSPVPALTREPAA
jgi:uncharacterized protein (TIGR00661 family)